MNPEQTVTDLINRIIESGVDCAHRNGKVVFSTRKIPNPPWRYFSFDPRMNCALWKQVIYNGLGIIPSPCHECYKVVVVPNSLFELKKVERMMEDICHVGFHGKCGIERRPIGRKYGGYFYARGFREGEKRFDVVRSVSPCKSFLKRGCTEFELTHGPAADWKVTPSQVEIENEIEKRIVVKPKNPEQTAKDIARVYDLWKKHSMRHDLIIGAQGINI